MSANIVITSSKDEDTDDHKEHNELTLWDSQKKHTSRVIEILNRSYSVYDTSETGSGKTHVSLFICAAFKLKAFVVCPKSLIEMWSQKAEQYGIPCVDIMTYDKLRGTTRRINHDYLEWSNNSDAKSHERFRPSRKFLQLVKDGIYVIFDEAHRLKTPKTSTHSAGHALVNAIIASGSRSRIACLSASPYDLPAYAKSTLQILGIIPDADMYEYNRSTKSYQATGIDKAYQFCRRINPRQADEIYFKYGISRFTIDKMCNEFYTKIIKFTITSSMKKPAMKSKLDCQNLLCRVTRDSADELLKIREQLLSQLQYDPDKGIYKGERGDAMRAVMGVHKHIEFLKMKIFIRLIRAKLEYHPNSKVLVFVWYLENMGFLEKVFSQYNPLILNGSVTGKKRTDNIEKFQQPNLEHRLIISIPTVGGVGISLDDTHGGFPRYQLISPGYKMTDLYQCMGRIHRGTTKSSSQIRFVYAENFVEEITIMDRLARKSEVTKNTLHDKEGVMMPGDLPIHRERVGELRACIIFCIEERKKQIKTGASRGTNNLAVNLLTNIIPDMVREIVSKVDIPYIEKYEETIDGYDQVFGREQF